MAQQQQHQLQNGSVPKIRSSASASPQLQTKMTPVKKNVIAIGKVKRRVTELKCAEVRWFYRRREDAKWWTPFKGFDSMVLELAYRRKNGMTLDEATKSHFESSPVPERSVNVLDGNYKADEQMESIEAIYWGEDTMKITRGSWFYADTNQPVPADFADTIEAHHLKNFRDNVIPETPVFSESESSKKPVLTTLKWSDKEVRWNSVVDVFIAGQKSRVLRWVTRAEGNSPLRRGFKEEANPTEGKPHFSDLILVVHGIGQKGYQNLIAKNTAQIREAIAQLMEKNYGSERRKPAILPVEWRSVLALDEGVTDIVTLPKMKVARAMLNSTLMDLMYYQSPLYRTEIVNGVIKCLNTIHTTFMENNPDFDGPISILGHSLGSVIAYDIITHWSPFLLYDHFVANAIAENITKSNVAEERKLLEDFQNSRKKMLELGGVMEQILIRQEERLKFRIKYLFCVGSPLAIFLIMRGADYKSLMTKPEQVDRIFNIFHPYDPVAYRLEPLFHENYRKIRPLKLFSASTAKQSYEAAVYECHASYRKKANNNNKKKKKEDKKGNSKDIEDKSTDGTENGKDSTKAPSEADDDEKQYFRMGDGDTDSDGETGKTSDKDSAKRAHSPPTLAGTPNTPLANNGTATLAAPEEVDSACEAGEDGDEPAQNGSEGTEVLPAGEQGKEKPEEGPIPEVPEAEKMPTPTDDEELKRMGDAAYLIEEIPLERRLPRRIDFQVQQGTVPSGYWAMLKSHFSYWTNSDVAAFLLNAIYPPPPPP